MKRPFPALAAAALVAVLLLAGCGDENGDAESAADPSPAATQPLPEWAPEVVTDEDDVVTGLDFADTPAPGSELEVEVLTEGDGATVEAGQTINVNYLGQTYDGTDPDNEPFDGNYGSDPIGFPIGAGAVIPGWDQALVGKTVGSRVLMSIPSELGYGAQGYPPAIPGGATLYFVVDIVSAS